MIDLKGVPPIRRSDWGNLVIMTKSIVANTPSRGIKLQAISAYAGISVTGLDLPTCLRKMADRLEEEAKCP